MSLLPDIISSRGLLGPREMAQAERAQGRAMVRVFRHALDTRVLAECDQLDTQAAGDALQFSMDAEINLLDHGLGRANGNQAKVEIVARKVEMFSDMNNRRISRRFGG